MSSPARSIAFVSREVTPLVGGGIAPVVRTAGELLAAEGWEVTFVTDGRLRERFEELTAAGDPSARTGARWVWVDAGDHHGDFTCWPHYWSAQVDRVLRDAYPDRAPDVIEFSDYLAEGFVTVQRRQSRDPWLASTLVAVRIHTSSELCSVLNGSLPTQFADRAHFDIERYCIAGADRLLYAGGDIYETYRRYYGSDRVAPGSQIPHALPMVFEPVHQPEARRDHTGDDTLSLLYLGRTERRKGIVRFAEALSRLAGLDVRLKIIGGDTQTGPLGTSVREHLELLAASDDRIEVLDAVPRDEVPGLFADTDAMVVCSPWECWPNTALEAMLSGTPVISTPVGGLVEMVQDGLTGIVGAGTDDDALEALLRDAVARRDELRRMGTTAAFRQHVERLTSLRAVVAGYEDLAHAGRARRETMAPLRRGRSPLVSVIVPYFRLDDTVEATLRSLTEQTYPSIEVIIANDGSFREQDHRVYDLSDRYGATVVTGPNRGLSAARNLAIAHARGSFICPLDADDTIAPDFIERGVRALLLNPGLAYVTSWVRYVDDDLEPLDDPDGVRGYFPLGNWSSMMPDYNVAGVCTSVMRREIFHEHGLRYDTTLASYEDWDLYQQMAERGLHGAVIPDRLFDYRVRAASMTRADAQPHLLRLHDELRAARLRRATPWLAPEPQEAV